MEASFLDLRQKSNEIMQALQRQESVTVSYRGKPVAVMHPIRDPHSSADLESHPAFGMWADRADLGDVAGYVRKLRRGRFDGR